FSTGLIVPILSLLLLDKGITLSQLAIIIGIYSLTTIVIELPSGVFADLYGRKLTFLLSLILTVISFGIILFSSGFIGLAVAILFYGSGRAFSSGAMDALIMDWYVLTFGKESIHKASVLLSVTECIGLSAGAIVGGLLPNLAQNYFPAMGKYDLNVIIKIIFIILAGVFTLLFIHEADDGEPKEKTTLSLHLKSSAVFVKENKTILSVFISIAATGFAFSTLEIYWQPRFQLILNNSSLMWLLGILAFLYFASAMCGNMVIGKLFSKIVNKHNTAYIVAKTLITVCLFTLALQSSAAGFIVMYVLIYFFFGAANVIESVILNEQIPSEKRASILSLNSLVAQAGSLTASAAGSIVIYYSTIPVLWGLSAAVLLLSTGATALGLYRKSKVPV
ncbi:MAG: hypothetical protein K0Q85_1486, partial [Caproiciproducens sp.]|nr:hypothetical protein [Caproiciproducens sp.]